MPRNMSVSDSVTIAADPQTLWSAVADPSQMPRWSPENTAGEVPTPGTPLSVGDVFVGANRRGPARWRTQCRVTAAEPGRAFEFDVVSIGIKRPRLKAPIARWGYTFAAAPDGGTIVTETWTDRRTGWPDWAAAAFDKAATRGSLFADFQRRNIKRTLAALKADFETLAS